MKKILDAIWMYIKHTDRLLILITLSASAYGFILVYSATHGRLNNIVTQLGAIGLGLIGMVIVSKIDYHDLAQFWKPLMIIGALLLLTPYLSPHRNTNSADLAWVNLGFTTVQPSEFVKYIFIVTFAKHLDMVKEEIHSFKNVVLLALHAALPLGIILIQEDMGMMLVYMLVFVFMMFAGNVQLRYFAAVGVMLLVSSPIIWNFIMGDDQRERILALFDPNKYKDTAMQQLNARSAIGSGEMYGFGLFHGPRTQSSITSRLPERQNDMIFAVAGEELGFIGCMVILAIFIALAIRLIMLAHGSKDTLGALICVGVFAAFSVQMMINLGMVLMVLPVIGIALPLFSSGGSSTMSAYIAIGLALSVYMHRKNAMFGSPGRI